MNQLALNLVAIAVFAMTLSALLGPMLHVSPAIPAIATISVLGLATLDSFSWQGKGGTLVLDWLASWSAEHRDRVLRHEAGHFLVAHHLQIPVTGYTLNAWEAFRQGHPGEGGVQLDTQELETEVQMGQLSGQLLDRYCAIWMAGAAAEHLCYGSAQGGADDRQKLRMVLAQLPIPPAERQQKERWAALRAKTVLQENWAAYEALVDAMQRRAAIADCTQVLVQTATAQPAVDLAAPVVPSKSS